MMVTRLLLSGLILIAAGLPLSGCSSSNPTPQPAPDTTGQPGGSEQTYTARTGNGVDVFYFEEENPCECMAEFGVVIKDAIRTSFTSELQDGSLRFFVVFSDDWSNREVLEMFDNPFYDLYIVEFESGNGTATPVREIWSMMGDDDVLASYVEARVRDALSRHGAS